jgi:hypothetical protein
MKKAIATSAVVFLLLTIGFGQSASTFGNAPDFSATISPAQITSSQNNYSPSGLCMASTLRLSTDASRNITGMQSCTSGWVILLRNVGAQDVVLKDASGSSSAANRFDFGGSDKTVSTKAGIFLQYDGVSQRWVTYSGSGSSISTPVSVANGGTGLASGTSGGVLYFSDANTIASSSALTANVVLKGAGAGAAPAGTTITDDGTTVTTTATSGISTPQLTTTNSNSGIRGTEGTGANLAPSAGTDTFWPDSTAHCWKSSFNNDTASCLARFVNNLSVFGATTSAQFLGVISDEVGSGAKVAKFDSVSGNSGVASQSSGALTSGNLAKFDANGNVVDAGAVHMGYQMVLANPQQLNPLDGITYYMGQGSLGTTTYNNTRLYVPKACTAKVVSYTTSVNGTLGSNENVTIDIYVNGTTQMTSSNVTQTWDAAARQSQVTSLSYALAAGDYVAVRVQSPTWVTTNPTNVTVRGDLYCE